MASHGDYRAENPLFSSLRLGDGPLTVYDLERVRRVPSHVVLSACDSGLSAARPGDELLGLASSLLAMGTRSLVASIAPVPDAAATALARARAALASGGGPSLGVGSLFQCFGSG